jgi:predicted alpha/beta-fold hydrolase
MLNKIRQLITLLRKKLFGRSPKTIHHNELSVNRVNAKIKSELKIKRDFINLSHYEVYFAFLRKLGLWKSFQILSTRDSLILRGSSVRPLIINENNDKMIFFCHGVTSNQWSLFYCIHLVLQLGYQVVIYDAREHGASGKSYVTLGKVEADDLEDVINWAQKHRQPRQIGLYGFSMGAATLLFWLSSFQKKHPEIKFLICEAPFDSFSKQFKDSIGTKNINTWRYLTASRFLKYILPTARNLEEINPISVLPDKLKLKLLLLHGTADSTISWKASRNIWQHFYKIPANRKYINCYFVVGADHGEIPFIGDALVGRLRWIKASRQKSQFNTFTELLTAFLRKNF